MKKIRIIITSLVISSSFLISAHAKKIQINVAMQEEAEPIINILNLKYKGYLNKLYKNKYYFSKRNGDEIYLIINGKDKNVNYVGAEPTTIGTVLGIDKFRPDVLVNIGTAGAFSKDGLKAGDIFNISEVSILDRNIPFEAYKNYTEGHFKPSVIKNDNKTAINCSSLSFVTNDSINSKMKNLGCNTFDMEASSFAFIATETKIKYYIIKGITDFIDKESNPQQFKDNFKLTADNLAIYLKDNIRNL